jgi:hypothetical protein
MTHASGARFGVSWGMRLAQLMRRRQAVPDPVCVVPRGHVLSLGDILQRLAIVAPEDLEALDGLARDVWRRYEQPAPPLLHRVK